MDVELEFLHNGLPKKQLTTIEEKKIFIEPPVQINSDLSKVLISMLKRLNIASYEFISNQYDHEVQASSVLKPLQGRGLVNADAAVLKPVLDSKKGIVLTSALAPTYSEIDSYKMAASSIDSSIRTAIAAGGDIENLALLDNFCWCSSTDPVRLNQLKKAVKACFDYSVLYGTPLISGKDSMFNDFKGFDKDGKPLLISIPPTLLISSIGVMKDATKAISIDFKFARDLVYVLGDTYDELGGSEYFALLGEKDKKEYVGNNVPDVGGEKNKKLYKAFSKCTDAGIIASAISVGRGGLAVALSKSAIAGRLGVEISLEKIKGTTSDDFTLFSESQGRILVSINPKNREKFEKTLKGNSFTLLGKVSKDEKIKISGRNKKEIVNINVADTLKSYKSTFKDF
jgi:phosphoribosylformylglycinamidine synthase